jgi:soluble lytic murein transglycosylase-like protein
MPETAKGMGLEVKQIVDERYNLEKSTQAACIFLLLKAKFGSWTLAAASYNRGMAGVRSKWNQKNLITMIYT